MCPYFILNIHFKMTFLKWISVPLASFKAITGGSVWLTIKTLYCCNTFRWSHIWEENCMKTVICLVYFNVYLSIKSLECTSSCVFFLCAKDKNNTLIWEVWTKIIIDLHLRERPKSNLGTKTFWVGLLCWVRNKLFTSAWHRFADHKHPQKIYF